MSTLLSIFIVILLITLGITYWAAKRTKTTSDFYAADSQLTASQNGFALAGDWCSAAAFLGFSGLTALYGMDGALYALGPLVAFCTVLFLIAEPLRNSGKYTLGDVVRSRLQTRTSLLAVIVGTVVVNFAYLMPQMAGAGVLVHLLTGISYAWAVLFVGVSMIVYVAFGGMLATTWVQIVKAVLMLAAGALILVLALWTVQFNPVQTFFDDAEETLRRAIFASRKLPEKSVRPDFARTRICARPCGITACHDAVLYGAGCQDRAPLAWYG